MSNENKRETTWLSAGLALLTLAVYARVGTFDFINFDDPEYVYENYVVRQGLTWEGIVWAFTRFQVANYHPITWLSHMLDCELFGVRAGWHHLVNVLLHALNSSLLFVWLKEVTHATWRSLLVAALFALHPAHVESVAWISERKDVLSTLFGLLSIISYSRWVQQNRPTRHPWKAFAFFVLSLLSKPMLVTLPFALLLLDIWPLNRLSVSERESVTRRKVRNPNRQRRAPDAWGRGAESVPAESEQFCGSQSRGPGFSTLLQRPFLRLVAEKVPWFLITIAISVVTFLAQKAGGAVSAAEAIPVSARVLNAAASYVSYLRVLFWPADLAVFYPMPRLRAIAPYIPGLLLLVAISAATVRWRCRFPYALVGWLWYLGTLVPVIGFVQVGSQAMADRYTYIASIGIFIAFIWIAWEALRRFQTTPRLALYAGTALVIGCVWGTAVQLGHWRDSVSLFSHTLKVTVNNSVAANNLAAAYADLGRNDDALRLYQVGVAIDPNSPLLRANLGAMQTKMKQYPEALENLERALALAPDEPRYHNLHGRALVRTGQTNAALNAFRTAIRLKPNAPHGYNNVGATLVDLGRIDDGIVELRRALELDPTYIDAYNNLGAALVRKGDLPGAMNQYRQALQLDPKNAVTLFNLAAAAERTGNIRETILRAREAVQVDPEHLEARFLLGRNLFAQADLMAAVTNLVELIAMDPEHARARLYLGLALFELGIEPDAIQELRAAVASLPDSVEALNAVAWALATAQSESLRDGAAAVRFAERAATLTGGKQAPVLHTLAASYAAAEQFQAAIQTAETALAMAEAQRNSALSAALQNALQRYRQGQRLDRNAP